VSAIAIDPGSNVLYAGAPAWYPAGVFTSADGGDTWSDTNLRQDVTSLAVSQSVVYAGTSNGVFKIVGSGTWAPASGGIQESVTSLAVSSANPDFAYAGTNTALFSRPQCLPAERRRSDGHLRRQDLRHGRARVLDVPRRRRVGLRAEDCR
jgi:hypothetical protein